MGFWVFLVHPTVTVTVTVCGIGATIRISREMLCLPYAGFFHKNMNSWKVYPFMKWLYAQYK